MSVLLSGKKSRVQESSNSKYQLVRNKLEQAIKNGEYSVGSQLPPQNELAKQFNVSLLTIRQALSLLEEEGLISREQGRGTFIERNSTVKEKKNNIILVFAERYLANSSYQRTELQVLERMLGERNKHLVLATLTSQDIVLGKVPSVLESEMVEGVLLENFVQDIHIEFLKHRGFPLVVIGSYDIKQDVAQIIYNQGKAVYLMSKSLLDFGKGQLYFLTEPFKYHYTYELAEGYSKACKDYGQDEHLILIMNEEEDAYSKLLKIVKKERGPFSLLIHANIAHVVVDVFNAYNLHLEEHPVAIYGAADYVPPYVRTELNQCTLNISKGTEVAIETLNRVINGEKINRVVLEPQLHTSIENGLLRMILDWNKPSENV